MAVIRKAPVRRSSGNVFADLGLHNAEEALAKAKIASRICDIIAERRLSQTRAASLLGVDQPKVSALMRGRLEGFSSDRLFRFLCALGRDVEIVIRPKSRAAARGCVRVVVA
ncbi:MAG TPA: transcriptional regulator [Planctomycetes bacterium]|jgi:predicted XRE-type DNA-binding protein|nr:transcriptional regulator [Planctomycetota bacterium]